MFLPELRGKAVLEALGFEEVRELSGWAAAGEVSEWMGLGVCDMPASINPIYVWDRLEHYTPYTYPELVWL